MRTLIAAFVAVVALPVGAAAQASDPTITTAVVNRSTGHMTVIFSQSLTASTGAPHLDERRVRLLPDNVTPQTITQNALKPNTFALVFASVPATATRICFDQVEFAVDGKPSQSARQVCANLSDDFATGKAALVAAFEKVPRTSRDKDIFASGFVTAASDDTAGGADISLNPDFNIPNLNALLRIKKATADGGDARTFEAGTKYRFTRPWNLAQLRAIAAETDATTLNELVRERQQNLFAGWLVDVAAKLEGDPTNFDVTNFVGESGLHLQTMTKRVGGKGFWHGFIRPAGLEIGQSLGTTAPPTEPATPETPAEEVNRIARYKAGAGLTLYYDSPGTPLGVRRVEVELNAVLRHLFLAESRFNEETKETDKTDDGLHGYGQVDLKVFLGETNAGRFGFKLSYNRGRLPPVFAEVKSFEFGFLIESGDDDGKANASNGSSRR